MLEKGGVNEEARAGEGGGEGRMDGWIDLCGVERNERKKEGRNISRVLRITV